MLYSVKKTFRLTKKVAHFNKLRALKLPSRRIAQLVFTDVEKKYFEYLTHDDWFDIVTYISNSDDGARSYHQQNPWLECFILPWSLKASSEVSKIFQSAHVKFELAPTEFIEKVERFSKLLQTRDLCKLLLEYLGNDINEDRSSSMLQFWMSLQAGILEIMQSEKSLSTALITQALGSQSFNQTQGFLQHFRESRFETSYLSVPTQLQDFLTRSTDDKEMHTLNSSK